MKKSLFNVFSTVIVLVALAACGKSDDGGESGGGTVAATPTQNCNIPGNTGCNPGVYQQYAPNFQTFQYSNANGFCGCPAGYRPVMNMTWGISCAPDNWFPTSTYYSYNYNTVLYYSQNNQWSSIPQITYSPATAGNNTSCSTAASVCDTRLTDPSTGANSQCQSGASCRATSGGSYVGLCTVGYGSDSYNRPANSSCYRYTSYYGWVNVCAYGSYGTYGSGGAGLPR